MKEDYVKTSSYEARIGEVSKVVLLYSGGLDTSCILKWIKDKYKAEVIALTLDLGQQEDDLDAIKEKALKLGAKKAIVLDVKKELSSLFLLNQLLDSGKTSSVELITFFIQRIKKLDPQLNSVVELFEEQALHAATQSDKRRKLKKKLSLVDGIPFGVKDLFSTSEGLTAWGSPLFKNQKFDFDATVITRLKSKGAILLAKLSTGELAFGDVWYQNDQRKQTKNPWILSEGSMGSSAGPVVAVAAGLLPFSLGTETWGSLMTPAFTNGVTALRPTLDRVSRYGVMPLSWSMDKIGPICRFAEDCLYILSLIHGHDSNDPKAEYCPIVYSKTKKKLKIGYIQESFLNYDNPDFIGKKNANTEKKEHYLKFIQQLSQNTNYDLVPINLSLSKNDIYPALTNLKTESTAVFQVLPLHNLDEKLGNQPNDPMTSPSYRPYFLSSTLLLAFDNQNAYRLRERLSSRMSKIFIEQSIDLYLSTDISDSSWSHSLLVNLTGHPGITFPIGFTKTNRPIGVIAIAPYFGESMLTQFAAEFQNSSTHHMSMPSFHF